MKMAKNQSSILGKGQEPYNTCSEFILSLSLSSCLSHSFFQDLWPQKSKVLTFLTSHVFIASQNTEGTKSIMSHHLTIEQSDANGSEAKFILIFQVYFNSQLTQTYVQ